MTPEQYKLAYIDEIARHEEVIAKLSKCVLEEVQEFPIGAVFDRDGLTITVAQAYMKTDYILYDEFLNEYIQDSVMYGLHIVPSNKREYHARWSQDILKGELASHKIRLVKV